jgi:hypothetical protein
MSCSVTIKRLDDEASAGWTTYGTFRAAFSLFQGVFKDDMKAPQRINHEETKSAKKKKKNFVLFVSSWLIHILL